MSRFVGIAVALLVVLNSFLFSDSCNHDPFPPFPPSPPEFQTPVAVRQDGNTAILSWVPVNSDGYSVLLCESGKFVPVAHNVQSTDLTLSNFGRNGVQEFLVMAFVKVADNLVYNSGAIGSHNFVATSEEQPVDPDQTQVAIVNEQQSENQIVVSMANRAEAVSSLPKFNGTHSFYSAKYPEVKNPFHPTTLPTGEIVPVLLLDKDIDDTVERLILKTKIENARVSKATNPAIKPNLADDKGFIGVPEVGINKSRSQTLKDGLVNTGDKLSKPKASAATSEKEIPKEKSKSNSSNVMIIIVVVILIIFFQLFKEGK